MTKPLNTFAKYVALSGEINAGHYADSLHELMVNIQEGGGQIADHEFFELGQPLDMELVTKTEMQTLNTMRHIPTTPTTPTTPAPQAPISYYGE